MNKYELIGIILGDGNIYYNEEKSVYTLEITGNADEDVEYYQRIKQLLFELSAHEPKLKIRHEKLGRSLRLLLYNKEFLKHLIDEGLYFKDKTNSGYVPAKFLEWNYMKHILRGFFETDGSLYFTRINNIPKYPRLELKTNSPVLASQFFDTLHNQGFKVQRRKMSSDKTHIIYLSGKEQLEKWINEIGFSSLKNKSKYELWKKLTFYIPRTSSKERLQILRR